MTRYAITGHRPQYLDGDDDYRSDLWIRMGKWFSAQYKDASLVISGGALGVDTLAAKVALESDIALLLALPFEGYDQRWADKHKRRLSWLMDRASDVVYVCDPGYAPWKYQRRNEFMVDICDKLLGVWHGKKEGGTWNCLEYAKLQSVPFTIWTPPL